MSGDELVLGVARTTLLGPRAWRGVLSLGAEPYLELIARHGTFRPRAAVEDDPTWKQVIPYLALRDRGRLFLMRRSRAGSDARLHDRYSIGIGGHVNPPDGDLAGGLRREWREEIAADFEPTFRLYGLLNDDEDPVGAVHLGVIYVAEAAGRPVDVRERDKLSGAFVPLSEVARVYDRLETWSSLLFDFLTGRVAGVRGTLPGQGAETAQRP